MVTEAAKITKNQVHAIQQEKVKCKLIQKQQRNKRKTLPKVVHLKYVQPDKLRNTSKY